MSRAEEGVLHQQCGVTSSAPRNHYITAKSLTLPVAELSKTLRCLSGARLPSHGIYVMQAATSAVVDGLFSALASLGLVPIIRCPKVFSSCNESDSRSQKQHFSCNHVIQCITQNPKAHNLCQC